MTVRTRLLPWLLLFGLGCSFACGSGSPCGAESALERQVSRPSITMLGLQTDIRAVSLEYLGGYSPAGESYRIRFTDDDLFVYDGFGALPPLGRISGQYPFVDIAAWLATQPVSSIGNLGLGGGVDYPTFTVVIERTGAPTTVIHGGLPIADVEVWGLINCLQGVVASIRSIHPRA